VSATTIEVGTPRGTMPVHVSRPGGDRRFPLVVLFMDAPGIRPALHRHAQRLVEAGYAVALPDLYYSLDPADVPDVAKLDAGDRDEFARMSTAIRSLRDVDVVEETGLMLERLPERDAGWSFVGFCMGARFGLRAAERLDDDVHAAALLHPSRCITEEPDSPHLRLSGGARELFFGFGEHDHVTPPSVIPALREQLELARIPNRIDVIPGADHGFTMPGMPSYDETAAERAWEGTMAVLAGGR
jgi:carboxymethylenebutenolidase